MDGRKLAVDEVIRLYTGSWGLWQIRTFLVVASVKSPMAWQMAAILFTAASPRDFWCEPPDELGDVNVSDWRTVSHPMEVNLWTGLEKWNPCYIYKFNYSNMTDEAWRTSAPATDAPLEPCHRFGFDSEETIIKKWHLVCGRRILISTSQFCYLLGILIGGVIAFKLTDRFGYRRVLLVAFAVQLLAGVSAAYCPFVELQFLARFVVATSCSVAGFCAFAICTDIVSSSVRTIFGCCVEVFWAVGVITLAIWAFFLPNWKHLQIALSVPTLLHLLFFKLIPESPKWLLRTGKFDEAKNLLTQAAQCNRRKVPEFDLERCLQVSTKKAEGLLDLVKEQRLLQLILLEVAWAFTVLSFYGSLVNVKNLGSNVNRNTVVAGCCEIVGFLSGLTIALWFTRKWLASGMILLVGGLLSCMSCMVPSLGAGVSESEAITVALAMPGAVASGVSLVLLQMFSAAEFPEPYRGSVSRSFSILSKIVLLSAPFINEIEIYDLKVAQMIYGSALVLTGISALVLSCLPTVRPAGS